MKEINFNTIYLPFITVLFYLGYIIDTKNTFIYFFILVLISLAVILTSKEYLVNASNLFVVYYIYVLGFGPIILLYEKLYLGFDYYLYILGGLLCFAWGNYLWGVRTPRTTRVRVVKRIVFNLNRTTIIRVLWVVSVVAGVMYLLKNRDYLFSGDIQNGRVTAMYGNGILIQLSQMTTALIPMLYQVYYDSRYLYDKKKKFNI